jgi:protein TonB
MSNISLADQLEDAIEMMIAEPDSAPPKVDLKIGELLGIAAELRLLPAPEFRAALKAGLLGQKPAAPLSSRVDLPRPVAGSKIDKILPALSGASDGMYPVHRGNFAISVAMHLALIALVATAGFWISKQPQLVPHAATVLLTDLPYPMPPSTDKVGGGGGGGDRDRPSESNGKVPRFAREQITPPAIVVRNEQPRLLADPTVVGPPMLTIPTTSDTGNPLSAILPPSNGAGLGGGIGSGEGGGVGAGRRPGFGPGIGGGVGGGVLRVGGDVSAPHPIYDPDPDYSEEARRAKFQGTVMLWVVIGPDGRPRDVRVARTLGMGLDQKAMEAVREWKFAPAMLDGRAVAVEVNIEVTFHLY